jgi:hypothetical protein
MEMDVLHRFATRRVYQSDRERYAAIWVGTAKLRHKPRGKKRLEVGLSVLIAILLILACQGRHPYGFYVVLRLAATVGAVYWAMRVYQTGPRGWLWVFVAVALLLNPLLPVRMHRADWQPIDLTLGVLLLAWAAYWGARKPRAL